jgi:hypothetical protein
VSVGSVSLVSTAPGVLSPTASVPVGVSPTGSAVAMGVPSEVVGPSRSELQAPIVSRAASAARVRYRTARGSSLDVRVIRKGFLCPLSKEVTTAVASGEGPTPARPETAAHRVIPDAWEKASAFIPSWVTRVFTETTGNSRTERDGMIAGVASSRCLDARAGYRIVTEVTFVKAFTQN